MSPSSNMEHWIHGEINHNSTNRTRNEDELKSSADRLKDAPTTKADPCTGLRVVPPSLGQRPRPKHWEKRVAVTTTRSLGQSHVLLLTPSRPRVATYTRSTTIASGCHHRQTCTTRTIQPRPIDDPELCCPINTLLSRLFRRHFWSAPLGIILVARQHRRLH
jgi:hypothetical protein